MLENFGLVLSLFSPALITIEGLTHISLIVIFLAFEEALTGTRMRMKMKTNKCSKYVSEKNVMVVSSK